MTSLHELQKAFSAGLLGGDAATLAPMIAGGRLPPLRRLAVHANHYRLTLVEALAATFPATRGLIGAEAFAFAGRRFVAERPPREPRLWAYGAGFSGFLSTLAEARELPWLPGVARLEWALNLAFHAPDAPALDPLELAALPPDELRRVRLAMHPSCGLVASRYPVLALWRAGRGEGPAADPAADGDLVLTFRQDGEAALRRLDPPEFRWLAALRAGRSAARALQAAGAGFDPAPLLAELLACGALSRLRLNLSNEGLEP